MNRKHMRCLVFVTTTAIVCGAIRAETGDRCSTSRKSSHFLATERAMREGVLVEYDESRHADLGNIIRKYWLARLSGSASELESLFPPLPPGELKRQIEFELALWASPVIQYRGAMAIEFRARDERSSAIVFTHVLVREHEGRCVEDVVATELAFDQGWFLIPKDDTSGVRLHPLRN